MEITCAACGQTVSIGAAGAGKCPKCGASIAKAAPIQPKTAAKPASAGKLAGGLPAKADDLVERLLAEVRRLGGQAAAVAVASEGELEPGIFPAASEAFRHETSRWRPATWKLVIVIPVVAVGCAAFAYIRTVIRDQAATTAIQSVKADKASAIASLQQADKERAAKQYAVALQDYRATLDLCTPLLIRLQQDTAALPNGSLKGQADALASEVLGYEKKAQDAIQSPDVSYGSRGMIQTDDGQWVTPAQKNKMFLDQMKAEGRTLYKGQWLTDAEIHRRNGEVPYQGGWITAEQYAKIMQASPTATPPPPKPVAPSASEKFLASDPVWVLDDFGKGSLKWTNVPVGWNANPGRLSPDETGDSPRLLVSMLAGKADKTAIVRPITVDLRSRATLSMDIFNATGGPVRIAIGVGTGQKDDYFEGRWLTLKAGANTDVHFPLQSSDFKSAPNWTYSAPIGHPEAVRWLYILIYNYGMAGKIYFGHITALAGS